MKEYTALDLRNNQIHTSDFMLDKQRSFSCSLHMSNSESSFKSLGMVNQDWMPVSSYLP